MYCIVKNFGGLSMYPEGNQGKTEKLADKTWRINHQSPNSPRFLPPLLYSIMCMVMLIVCTYTGNIYHVFVFYMLI